MESVFSRFDSYDFAADRRFQDGLKTLQDTGTGNELLDMKLFFYNRFVEPIDRTSYKQWSSGPPGVTQLDQSSLSDSDIKVGYTPAVDTSTETEATQLSFAEVMRLVQEGKEVPGVRKLDVKPTNQSATPSQMERIRKPWEISSAPK